MNTMALRGIVGLILALAGSVEAGKRPIPACPPGRYLLTGSPLVHKTLPLPVDVVTIAYDDPRHAMVDVSGTCAGAVKLRATKRGTVINARLRKCPGLRVPARLSGRIDQTCKALSATARARRVGKATFRAVLSACGDGLVDAGNGEQCEPPDGPTCDARCQVRAGSATVLMDPNLSAGFFSMPWPNDIRMHGDGTIDLDGWPGVTSSSLATTVLSRGSSMTAGFGTNAALYFQTSGPLDPTSLPAPEESLGDSSAVMLVNLDAAGTSPTPVILDFKGQPTTFRPGNLLTLLPYPGHPLAGTTRYAAILFEGLRDLAGGLLKPAPLLAALDEAWDANKPVGASTWAALQEQRDEVFAYVAQHTGRATEQILGFTVFTTQDVHSGMAAIAAAVAALPSPAPVSRTMGNCTSGGYASVSGQLDLPKWQEGTPPYLNDGGGIVIAGGVAVRQSTERVNFSMTFPCGPSPSGGWPILLFMDGTGACARSSSIPYVGYSPLPFVVASIAPLYSCERFPGGALPTEALFFNYLNPLGARTNQLQQAGDMLYLKRVIEGITLTSSETGAPGPVETHDDRVAIAGHSQGALTVPHALAADPELHAGFISAGGGGLYQSLIHRRDVRMELLGPGLGLDNLLGLEPGELDMFHPILHALQTFAEVGDAANYGRDVTTANVLLVGGVLDGCSPWETVSTLGTALGLQLAHPLLHPTFGSLALEPPIVGLPAVSNLPAQRTGVTVQLDTGHFGTVTNPNLGRSFLESFAASGVPTIVPVAFFSDSNPGCSRFDPLR